MTDIGIEPRIDPMERMKKSALSDSEHKEIFKDTILFTSGFQEAKKVEVGQPRAIILAGQPGAGKGNLTAAAVHELAKSGGAVTIDPDALRQYHSKAEAFRMESPYTWADDTQLDASAWAKSLRSAAIGDKKNVILDTTLGEEKKAIELVKLFQDNGYSVEIRAMAVPQSESELGVDKRFTDGLKSEGFGRYVPEKLRDDVYQNLPAVLDAVHAESLKKDDPSIKPVNISVYDRASFKEDPLNPVPRYSQIADRAPDDMPGKTMEKVRTDRANDPQVATALRDGWKIQKDLHANLETNLPTELYKNVKVEARGPLLKELATEKVADSVNRRYEEAEAHLSKVTVKPSQPESQSQPKSELLEKIQHLSAALNSDPSSSRSEISALINPQHSAQLHHQAETAVNTSEAISKQSSDRTQTPVSPSTPAVTTDTTVIRK